MKCDYFNMNIVYAQFRVCSGLCLACMITIVAMCIQATSVTTAYIGSTTIFRTVFLRMLYLYLMHCSKAIFVKMTSNFKQLY